VRVLQRVRRHRTLECVLGGCAIRPVTPELAHFVPGGGYRWDPARMLPDNDPETLLVLTFSGGGTRAADP
jgi:hypothetical protein